MEDDIVESTEEIALTIDEVQELVNDLIEQCKPFTPVFHLNQQANSLQKNKFLLTGVLCTNTAQLIKIDW